MAGSTCPELKSAKYIPSEDELCLMRLCCFMNENIVLNME